MLDAFPRFLRASQHQGLLRDVKKHIGKRLDKQWKKLRDALQDPDHDRHRLRLLIKRVRYAAEAYPELDNTRKSHQKLLKEAQSTLGDWHDHLQWLVQAQDQSDLARCVPGWLKDIEQAEKDSDKALDRLSKAKFAK